MRDVQLASATQAERQEDLKAARERMRQAAARTTSPYNQNAKSVIFTGSFMIHQYPAFIWGNGDELDEETDEEGYGSYEGPEDGEMEEGAGMEGMEPDDGMSWEENAGREAQARQGHPEGEIREQRTMEQNTNVNTPNSRGPGPIAAQATANRPIVAAIAAPTSQQSQLGIGAAPGGRGPSPRERMASGHQELQTSPSGRRILDPAEVTETRTISVTPDVARGADARQQDQSKRAVSPNVATNQGRSPGQGLQRQMSGESSTSLASRTSETGMLR